MTAPAVEAPATGCKAHAGTYVCEKDAGHGGKWHEAFAGRGDKRGTVKVYQFTNQFGTESRWVARRVIQP